MQIQIVEKSAKNQFKEVIELDRDIITLGRGRPQKGFVQLPPCGGRLISKIHCSIFRERQDWFIQDGAIGGERSHNGVRLNGERIAGPVKLEIGQVFVLLLPPPCEIQLQVVDAFDPLEDTLTPALEQLAQEGFSPPVVEELRGAIAHLHRDLTENRELDQAFRSEVAAAAVARERNEEALQQTMIEAWEMGRAYRDRLEAQEQRTKFLGRMISGVALGVAIALLSLSPPVSPERRTLTVELALEILLGLAGGGGLAAAGRFHNSGENDEDRFLAFDATRFQDSPVGDAGAGSGHSKG